MVLLRAFVAFIFVVLTIVFAGLVAWIPGYGSKWRLSIRKFFGRLILRALGIEITWRGAKTLRPCIIVANHRSYLDPLLIMQHFLALPVAKAEIASWPLIGYGTKLTGVFFVKREDKEDRRRTLIALTDAVKAGETILVFPEGTTHAEQEVRTFSKGVFHVAANEGVPIVPIALDFKESKDYWLDDDTFLGHFVRSFGLRKVRCTVEVGPYIQDTDPLQIHQQSMDWINMHLAEMRMEWNKEDVTEEQMESTQMATVVVPTKRSFFAK
jgi:1-acyl-sn-glycerol-3-phosphate acyltransferase